MVIVSYQGPRRGRGWGLGGWLRVEYNARQNDHYWSYCHLMHCQIHRIWWKSVSCKGVIRPSRSVPEYSGQMYNKYSDVRLRDVCPMIFRHREYTNAFSNMIEKCNSIAATALNIFFIFNLLFISIFCLRTSLFSSPIFFTIFRLTTTPLSKVALMYTWAMSYADITSSYLALYLTDHLHFHKVRHFAKCCFSRYGDMPPVPARACEYARWQLAITKTSEDLCRYQQRKGTWDRLEKYYITQYEERGFS